MTEKEKVIFTINVQKKELKEKDWAAKFKDIKIEDLKMYHVECHGGEITASEINAGKLFKTDSSDPYLTLCCNGCKKRIWIRIDVNPGKKIIRTAIDGQKRNVHTYGREGNIFPGYDPNKLQYELGNSVLYSNFDRKVDVYVIQKGSEDYYCPFCGSQIVTTAAYCHNCGTEIEERIKETKKVSTSNK